MGPMNTSQNYCVSLLFRKMHILSLILLIVFFTLTPAIGYDYWSTPVSYMATIKIDKDGNQVWADLLPHCKGYELSTQEAEHLYVVGYCEFSEKENMLLVKYQGNGEKVWMTTYMDNFQGPFDFDIDGNIYIASTVWRGEGPEEDILILMYDQSGSLVWSTEYDDKWSGDNNQFARGIAVDPNGNVYVGGSSYDMYLLLKYSNQGELIWDVTYDCGYENGYCFISDLVLDEAGMIYVTGDSRETEDSYFDITTVKYNANGDRVWATRFKKDAEVDYWGHQIKVDANGNVYVAGTAIKERITRSDYLIIKYDPNGMKLWHVIYDGPGDGDDYTEMIQALALDSEGNAYVTGRSLGVDTGYDITTIKYSPDGEELWVARYDSQSYRRDWGWDIAVDEEGNVYVAGESAYYYPAAEDDYLEHYVVIKYDQAGEEVWTAVYEPSLEAEVNELDAWPRSLALDDSGNVYVTGGISVWVDDDTYYDDDISDDDGDDDTIDDDEAEADDDEDEDACGCGCF